VHQNAAAPHRNSSLLSGIHVRFETLSKLFRCFYETVKRFHKERYDKTLILFLPFVKQNTVRINFFDYFGSLFLYFPEKMWNISRVQKEIIPG